MIRVVVTGSECAGKTMLAEALAARYETVWVPEYARRFVRAKAAAPSYEDVETIARGQIALEEMHVPQASRVLIQDTDLLSTVVYSRHYYGDCPDWIEEALERRAADLYLLAGIDVPWVSDGPYRDRGDRREEMHGLFRSALLARELDFAEIRGSHDERLTTAGSAIDSLMIRHAV